MQFMLLIYKIWRCCKKIA